MKRSDESSFLAFYIVNKNLKDAEKGVKALSTELFDKNGKKIEKKAELLTGLSQLAAQRERTKIEIEANKLKQKKLINTIFLIVAILTIIIVIVVTLKKPK